MGAFLPLDRRRGALDAYFPAPRRQRAERSRHRPTGFRRLYLAVWARSTPRGAEDGNIYLSTDAGATWRRVFGRDQHVYDVTIDPRDPRLLYAAGFEASAWRSSDRGLTWRRIPGFEFKWAHRIVVDPRNPVRIFITTFGGSVWHGKAD